MKYDLLIESLRNKEVTEEERDIIEAIADAREELNQARMFFNNEDEGGLIEYAIYRECAAKAKYNYYITKLKKIESETKNTNEAV